MYLTKITGDNLSRYGATERVYELHQLVWELFSNNSHNRERDFIYYLLRNGPSIDLSNKVKNELYIVSEFVPTDHPEEEFKMETKPYNLTKILQDGMYMNFTIRLNAEVNHELRRMSIMTKLAHKMKERNEPYNWNYIALQSSTDWLEKNGPKRGFKRMVHEVESFQLCKFQKPTKEKVSFYSMDLKGTLQITNSELFLKTLFKGLGKSKGYGCGLMLVAPYKN